jgi:hypothetical protein
MGEFSIGRGNRQLDYYTITQSSGLVWFSTTSKVVSFVVTTSGYKHILSLLATGPASGRNTDPLHLG